jgi:hypothetical protein
LARQTKNAVERRAHTGAFLKERTGKQTRESAKNGGTKRRSEPPIKKRRFG